MARYEFVEGASKKFWEIALEGTSFTTTYGRIGTDGQMSMKEFDSEETAKTEHDKLIAEKTKKGYALVAALAISNSSTARPASFGRSRAMAWRSPRATARSAPTGRSR